MISFLKESAPQLFDHQIRDLAFGQARRSGEEARGIFCPIFSQDGVEVAGLLGTLHTAPRKALELNAKIHASLQRSTILYLEIESSFLIPLGCLGNSFHLPDPLSAAQKERLETYIQRVSKVVCEILGGLDIPQDKIEDFRKRENQESLGLEILVPLVSQTAIALSHYLAKTVTLDFEGDCAIGIEQILIKHAQAAHPHRKLIKGLEEATLERMETALRSLSKNPLYPTEFGLLNREQVPTETEIRKVILAFEKCYNAWIAGDVDYFVSALQVIQKNDPDLYSKLIAERDQIMAAKMHEALLKAINSVEVLNKAAKIDDALDEILHEATEINQALKEAMKNNEITPEFLEEIGKVKEALDEVLDHARRSYKALDEAVEHLNPFFAIGTAHIPGVVKHLTDFGWTLVRGG